MTRKIFAYKRTFDDKSLTVVLNFTGRNLKNKFSGEAMLSNYKNSEAGVLRPYEAVIIKN